MRPEECAPLPARFRRLRSLVRMGPVPQTVGTRVDPSEKPRAQVPGICGALDPVPGMGSPNNSRGQVAGSLS